MSKSKTRFFCQSCGHEAAKWLGKCPSCGTWNSFVEEIITKGEEKNEWRQESGRSKSIQPKILSEIESGTEVRIPTRDQELDRVLGGGIVPGSVVLIGGEPGIGKSTLMLQVGLALRNLKRFGFVKSDTHIFTYLVSEVKPPYGNITRKDNFALKKY